MKQVLAGVLLLFIAIPPLNAEPLELSYQAVMHVRDSQSLPVLDRSDQVVGIAAFRGLAIFSEEEIAVHRYDGWFDLTDGSGPFHGYALWRFEDGSELTAAYEGAARRLGPDAIAVEAQFHDVTGSGRFAGASGEGTFSGRRLDAIDKGGSTYLNGILTLTMPD